MAKVEAENAEADVGDCGSDASSSSSSVESEEADEVLWKASGGWWLYVSTSAALCKR